MQRGTAPPTDHLLRDALWKSDCSLEVLNTMQSLNPPGLYLPLPDSAESISHNEHQKCFHICSYNGAGVT